MCRQMQNKAYRDAQWGARYAPHVEPLNRLVDALRETGLGSMPYVSPEYGGIKAEAILLYQDPGNGTDASKGGSGFLSYQNDDPSAGLACECLEQAGLSPKRLISWNAYPWYITGGPTVAGQAAAADALAEVIALLPRLRVVVLHGKVAQDAWPKLALRHPAVARGLRTFDTFHTSGQGIVNGGQQKKAVGVAHVVETFRAVRTFLDDEVAHGERTSDPNAGTVAGEASNGHPLPTPGQSNQDSVISDQRGEVVAGHLPTPGSVEKNDVSVDGDVDGETPVKGSPRRARLRHRVDTFVDDQQLRLVRSTRLQGEAGAALAESVRELAEATRRPWNLRATKRSIAATATRGLDRLAGIVINAPASIDDLDGLDQRATHLRQGVSAALTAIQGTLATGTVASDGLGGPPAVAIDAVVAQAASLLTGLAEWYLVGSYAAWLMNGVGLDPEPRSIRRVVNAALLSRHDSIEARFLEPHVEGRLIFRWITRGVANAVPFLSGYPTQRVRKAGRRLQKADLVAIVASLHE
jgi:hypothetical protein